MSSTVRVWLLVMAWLTLSSSAPLAHVVVTPGESEAGGWERYSVLVPTEKGSPTVKVEVKLPAGMEIVAVEAKAGWDGKHEPFPLGAARVLWQGGRIPQGQFLAFDFLAWNPPAAKPITWEATQWYEDGSSDRWAGPAHEASTTTLRPSSGKARHRHGPGK
jgi:uncharacterized protein YcnI